MSNENFGAFSALILNIIWQTSIAEYDDLCTEIFAVSFKVFVYNIQQIYLKHCVAVSLLQKRAK